MNGKCLLDTNIVIGLFAAEPTVMQGLREAEQVFIPSIVIGELYYGALHSTRAEENVTRIEQLVASSAILNCDVVTARHYGRIKNELRREGRPVPENDLWIAALALQYQLTLITRDKHFAETPDLQQQAW